MRIPGIAVAVLALVACSTKDEAPAVDTTAVVTPAAPAAITLADVAGVWDVQVKNEAGDSVLTTNVLTATADTTGWSMQFPGTPAAIPTRVVSVGGDSVVTNTGPYSSVLRKNVQVTVDGVYRLVDGKLVGKATAHYNVKTADSVRVLNTEGTKR